VQAREQKGQLKVIAGCLVCSDHTRGSGRSSRYAVPIAERIQLQNPHPRLRPIQQICRPRCRGVEQIVVLAERE